MKKCFFLASFIFSSCLLPLEGLRASRRSHQSHFLLACSGGARSTFYSIIWWTYKWVKVFFARCFNAEAGDYFITLLWPLPGTYLPFLSGYELFAAFLCTEFIPTKVLSQSKSLMRKKTLLMFFSRPFFLSILLAHKEWVERKVEELGGGGRKQIFQVFWQFFIKQKTKSEGGDRSGGRKKNRQLIRGERGKNFYC